MVLTWNSMDNSEIFNLVILEMVVKFEINITLTVLEMVNFQSQISLLPVILPDLCVAV